MPLALLNPSLNFSNFSGAQSVLTATGAYAGFAPMFGDPSIDKLILPEGIDFAAKADTDYGSQKRFSWTKASIVKAAADAGFNGKDAINLTDVDGDFGFDDGSIAGNGNAFSLMMVLRFATGAKSAAFNQLLYQYSKALNQEAGYLRYQSSGDFLTWTPIEASGNGLSVAGVLPAENVTFLLGLDYNRATSTSHLYVNNPATPVGTKTDHNTAPPTDMSKYGWWPYTRYVQQTIGFKGKAGLFWVRNGVWSDLLRTQLFTAVKAYYGIA